MTRWYFAYGSNMNPERVMERGLPFDDMQAGQLRGYQLVFNKRSVRYPGAATANVMQRPSFCVEGIVYRLAETAGIEAMDPFEGYPLRYDRFLLPVVANASLCKAWVYIANEEYLAYGLKPARWYLQHLLKGEAYLPKPYVETLRQVECLPESDVETE